MNFSQFAANPESRNYLDYLNDEELTPEQEAMLGIGCPALSASCAYFRKVQP